ncbi:MAG: anthranilate phosphoribosyltransferase [Planctomycetota bacterium]|nr:MAG: anthranilate phosphoribosyltransferase [Planctomycetota bacterium]
MIETILGRLSSGANLTRDECGELIDAMFEGGLADEQIALALSALRAKGETAEEIIGAALVLRQRMTRIGCRHDVFVDTCGTGGDRSGTFNVSTAAALVTAAAGLPVAKHGNRSFSSKSGSADVLAALGVNVQAEVAVVESCLDELGICFCFAPLWHRSMKRVATVRKKLGVPTIFNLLGPLANPAGAPFQVVGVGRSEMRTKIAAALMALGTRGAIVVHGDDGLDEVTLAGATRVSHATPQGVRELCWTPGDFGLAAAPLDDMLVEGPEESAALIRRVLAGDDGPARDIVVANAAAALWVAGRAATTQEAAALAAKAIDSGAAARLLAALAERSAS